MSEEANNLVLKLLREMRAEMATKSDLGEVRREVSDVRHDVGDLRHDVSEGFIAITRRCQTSASATGSLRSRSA